MGVESETLAFSEQDQKSEIFCLSEILATVLESTSDRFTHSFILAASAFIHSQEFGPSGGFGCSISFSSSISIGATLLSSLSGQLRNSKDLIDSESFPVSDGISFSLVVVSDVLKWSIDLNPSSSLVTSFIILGSSEMIASLALINSLIHNSDRFSVDSFSVLVSSHFRPSIVFYRTLFDLIAASDKIQASERLLNSKIPGQSNGLHNSNSHGDSVWLVSAALDMTMGGESFTDLFGSISLISGTKLEVTELQRSSPNGWTESIGESGEVAGPIAGSVAGLVVILIVVVLLYLWRRGRKMADSDGFDEQELSPESVSDVIGNMMDESCADPNLSDMFQLSFEEQRSVSLFPLS
jgi:hypothetical protein